MPWLCEQSVIAHEFEALKQAKEMDQTRQSIPVADFAEAMLKHGRDSFPSRVVEFESRFGKADADTLAVLAQAAYYCWGNCHYRDNLRNVCCAVGSGKPTSMYLHNQVDAGRWVELNTYVEAVQHWLDPGARDLPDVVDGGMIDQVGQWFGERSACKELLASMFLNELVGNLLHMNLTKLGDVDADREMEYYDFGPCYRRPDGTHYGRDRAAFTNQCVERLRTQGLADDDDGVEEIIRNLVREKPHSCMHRFTRHLDIQLTSIGVLKWRGNLPPDHAPKQEWIRFIEEGCGLSSWLHGEDPDGDYAADIHEALGSPTDRKTAIVADFLRADDRGDASSGGWISERSRLMGRKAYQLAGSPLVTRPCRSKWN